MDLFSQRMERLRSAIIRGPAGLTIKRWALTARVSEEMLSVTYPEMIREPRRISIARAAAQLLNIEPERMQAWLLEGRDEPTLEAFLLTLPSLARCAHCHQWYPRDSLVWSLRLCRVCNRIKKRTQANPQLSDYHARLRAALPEVRQQDPRLADAIEETLTDVTRAFSYTRVAARLGVSRRQVGALLKGLGLGRERGKKA